ncbi:MAG: radical SAM protein [Bacteroidales bacterium]|nr:radical SAM protein [Bacteroidales bacterium]
MLKDFFRNSISRYFTHQNKILLRNIVPSYDFLEAEFSAIDELGIYLHIPFCDRICPYCPYNKEVYSADACQSYVKSVIKEIDSYAFILKSKPVKSFYIGGGTPTTMLGKGIENLVNHIYRQFNMKCYVHMESHPNHLTAGNLSIIEALGVKYLSIGVEALQDRHLRMIERPYTVKEVTRNIERAAGRNFDCINIDYIFDLPGQTEAEVEQAGHDMVKMGIHQAATYPLFRFPYTRLGREFPKNNNAIVTMFRRRRFLKILEGIFYDAKYDRSSVWAFTKKGIDKYCSVTVPMYLGLGASGGTYLRGIFYVNTFSVKEYIKAIQDGRSPISLSIELTEAMQMTGWLYWRIYETRFRKSDFQRRFNKDFDSQFGKQMKILKWLGYLQNGDDQVSLSDKGIYWIHAFEDFFSIEYINKLWGASGINAWPEKVVL